jgi:hypothetical protein
MSTHRLSLRQRIIIRVAQKHDWLRDTEIQQTVLARRRRVSLVHHGFARRERVALVHAVLRRSGKRPDRRTGEDGRLADQDHVVVAQPRHGRVGGAGFGDCPACSDWDAGREMARWAGMGWRCPAGGAGVGRLDVAWRTGAALRGAFVAAVGIGRTT